MTVRHETASSYCFRFKQFAVRQQDSVTKVGTDSILLGAWADTSGGPRRVLDIGTGTGVIALMVAQRCPAADVTAIEIDPSAAALASQNFAASPWARRLRIVPTDVRSWTTARPFDLIVSNPPYFDEGIRSPTAARRTARHTDQLTSRDLFSFASDHLTEAGAVCVIDPVAARNSVIDAAAGCGLLLHEECQVRPTPQHDVHRVLLRFSRAFCRHVRTSELAIEITRHQYTPEYSALAKDFLLKL